MTPRTPASSTRIYDSLGDDIIAGRATTRIDNQTTYFYIGDAKEGSSESDSVWRIQKIDISANPYSFTWANGNLNYNNSWALRGTYIYV